MRYTLTTGLTAALIIFSIAAMPLSAQEVLDIGSRLELFVDEYLIDSMEGSALKLHAPRPAEVSLQLNRDYEGPFCGYFTVFQEGDLYRMYYRGLPVAGKDGSDAEVTCYAESKDGITFTRPNLGLYEINGSKENNVILADAAPYSHNFAPFLDTRPGAPAEEKYKALAGTSKTGLVLFISPDGIHWTKKQEDPVLTGAAFDSQNIAFWSESEQCYVAYFRSWSEGLWGGFRWVSRSTSKDCLTWTPTVEMDRGGSTPEHIYTNQTIPYFRAPHIYVAVAARFMPGRQVISDEEAKELGVVADYFHDCSDNVLMTSRGSNQYTRTFMEAFIKPGLGLENWTSRTNYPVRGIVQTGEKEISLYIQRNYGLKTAHIQRFALRPDGFASVNAPYAGGEMTTKAFTFSGKELLINFGTSAAGSVKVEIQDAAGKPIKGFTEKDSAEIIGSMVARTVRWKGKSDLSALAGTPIRLRFIMKDADLYSIQFK